MKQFKLMMSLLKEEKLRYLVGVVLSSLASPLSNIVVAFLFMQLFDNAVYDASSILPLLINFLLLILALAIMIPAGGYLINYAALKTTANLRQRTLKKLINLDQSTLSASHSGDLISRVTNDIQTAEVAYKEQLVGVTEVLFNGIGCTFFMILLNWKFALGIIGYQLFTLFLITRFAKPLKEASEEVQSSLGKVTEKISDILAGSHVIKLFNIGDSIVAKFKAQNDIALSKAEKRVKINAVFQGVNSFVWMSSFVGFITVSGWFMSLGYVELGALIALVQLQSGVTQLVNVLGRFINQLQKSMAGFERITELLEKKDEPKYYPSLNKAVVHNEFNPTDNNKTTDNDNITDTANTIPKVLSLSGVNFQYDEETKVINNLNLSLRKGETVAIVGPSGGGKSTLFKLLLGFHFPQVGEVSFMEKEAQNYTLEEIRDFTAFVPQEPYLFSGTVYENIAYGNEKATREDVVKAAKQANAHDFIENLEKGYDTLVGERGSYLSGGQKQRIAIARAIVKNAEILLLDEATSALDNESEVLVQGALDELMKEKTSIVIAHRLSTIEKADRILVMDQGTIVEEGTHEELLKQGGLYAKLA